MSNFNEKLAQIMGVEKITGLDKFSLFGGTIGLIVDITAIIGLAKGLIFPNLPIPKEIPTGGLLLTAFLGFYSLTLIIWFLIRFERSKREKLGVLDKNNTSIRTIDLIDSQMTDSVTILLVPLLGTFFVFFAVFDTMIISFLSVFISWLPVALWLYALQMNPFLAIGGGLIVSMFLSQYAIWFALILDKFFY